MKPQLICTIALATALMNQAQAQDAPKPKVVEEKKEVIVEMKEGGNKTEKMTIVVDGDNVTINGKPVSEFEGRNVKVIRQGAPHRATAPKVMVWEDANGGEPRAMLGVVTEKVDNGVKIQEVTPGSAAEKAGLKEGDIIQKIDDKSIVSPESLAEIIKTKKPEDKVTVHYERNGKKEKATAALGKWEGATTFSFNMDNVIMEPMPPMPPMEFREFPLEGGKRRMTWSAATARPKLGLQVKDREDGKGIDVLKVDADSPAAKAGFKEKDIILEVNGKAINTVDQMRMATMPQASSWDAKVQRNGKTQTISVKIPKPLKTVDL